MFRGFDDWYGADVVVATGWQTVYPALELDGVPRARVPDQRPRAGVLRDVGRVATGRRATYRRACYGIAGSPWLRDLYVERYGGQAGTFQYGVDHDVYRPRPVERRRDTVVVYAARVTPRRAVAAGDARPRRSCTAAARTSRIVLFGDTEPLETPFPYEHAGVAGPRGAVVAVLARRRSASACR